jgi:hypothetical protein
MRSAPPVQPGWPAKVPLGDGTLRQANRYLTGAIRRPHLPHPQQPYV